MKHIELNSYTGIGQLADSSQPPNADRNGAMALLIKLAEGLI